MRQTTILLVLLLLFAANGAAEASNFRISLGYKDCDDDGCGVFRYQNDNYKIGRYNNRYLPQYYVLRQSYRNWPYYHAYAPKTRQCYMATDKYGRKFRKCIWLKDSDQRYQHGCGSSHHSSRKGKAYGHNKHYCRYK